MILRKLLLSLVLTTPYVNAQYLNFSDCGDTVQNAKLLQSTSIKAANNAEIGQLELYYSFKCEGFKPIVKVRGVEATFNSTVKISLSTLDDRYSDSVTVSSVGKGEVVLGPNYSIAPASAYYQYHYPSAAAVTSFDNSTFIAEVDMNLGRSSNYSGKGTVYGTVPFVALTKLVSGKTYAINAYHKNNGSNIFMHEFGNNDKDQQWIWSGDRLRLRDTVMCMNIHNPSDGANVNLWNCDTEDKEQEANLIYGTLIEAENSGFCLNSYNTSDLSNLNVWGCSVNDSDQNFNQTPIN